MFELLCEQATAAPERAVAVTFDRSISYAALTARTRIVARRLRSSGVQRGDRVGLLCDNRVEWLEVLFAEARARIAIYGSAGVVAALAGFFRIREGLRAANSAAALVEVVKAMRVDGLGRGAPPLSDDDIVEMLFGGRGR